VPAAEQLAFAGLPSNAAAGRTVSRRMPIANHLTRLADDILL
jgi:hypothetical protein